METHRKIYNTHLEPLIFTVEQHIVPYQCRTGFWSQTSQWVRSCLPNLDIYFA